MIFDLNSAVALLDDIALAAEAPHAMLDSIEALLYKIDKISLPGKPLKLRSDKTSLLCSSIKFLGKTVQKGNLVADLSKSEHFMRNKPTDVQDMSSFVSFCSSLLESLAETSCSFWENLREGFDRIR